MWPGIASLSKEDFKVYDVAVIYSKNQVAGEKGEYVPIAVGRILTSQVPAELKGKAVQVEHYLYDELWNMGPKKIPEGIIVGEPQEAYEAANEVMTTGPVLLCEPTASVQQESLEEEEKVSQP